LSLADEEYVFSLEAIEAYIGQKIPVEWADGSLYVRENPANARRTPEKRTGTCTASSSTRQTTHAPTDPGPPLTSLLLDCAIMNIEY